MFKTGADVVSRTANLNQWEQITLSVKDARTGRVALVSDHNLWLCADPEGKVTANRKEVAAWETFTLLQADASCVALQSSHGAFLSAANTRVDAKARDVHEAQRFVLFDSETARSRYINSNPSDKVPESSQLTSLCCCSFLGRTMPCTFTRGGSGGRSPCRSCGGGRGVPHCG